MKVFWFIPTHGDGRYLGTSEQGRVTDYDYLTQIARAVDRLGYYGALLPTGRSCEDSWVVASSLIGQTNRMRFLVAIRPGLTTPGAAARVAATFDRLSNGRVLINVVTGGDPEELAGDGFHLSHDDRYRLTDEFLSVWRSISAGETSNFQGDYLKIRNGSVLFRSLQKPHPPLYFGGSSSIAQEVAARHCDVYLTWGEPPAQAAEKIDRVRRLAAENGRTMRFGIRFHVIIRETEAEAWAAANRLLRYVDDDVVAASQQALARHDSVGQKRMLSLHGGDRDSLVIGPNLWAGVSLVRGGAGTALVGDPDSVAERMQEYVDVGIDHFIFSGYPHLEEAYRTADLLFPKLKLDHDEAAPAVRAESRDAGEVIGNLNFPRQAVSG